MSIKVYVNVCKRKNIQVMSIFCMHYRIMNMAIHRPAIRKPKKSSLTIARYNRMQNQPFFLDKLYGLKHPFLPHLNDG